MDDYVDETMLELERYAIGQPVPRSEDPVLLRGEGHYADDISLPGQAYAVMVRSGYAHGFIRGIDAAATRSMPGVLGVYTATDLAAGGIGPLPPRQVMKNRDGTPMLSPVRYALAIDKARHVGEAIAAIVAETLAEAKDAAEAVQVEIEPLPAVTAPGKAAAPGAPVLYDDVPGNVGLDFHFGDSEKVAAAFASAAHVTRLQLRNNRIVVNAMEPRSAVAQYDPDRRHWTLHVGCQGVFGFRNYIAGVFGVGRDQVRVLTDRVGGSFGMKQPTYAEYYCILHAARELGRPVKWTDDRSGSFLSDSHGRDAEMTAELALDRDGNFLAVRLTGFGNLGATYGAPGPSTRNAVRNTLGVYKTPLIEVSTKCMFTNTTPVGAYRGAGRPEANYYMERLVETAATETGIDRVELRRKNHIPPEAMPYKAPNGTTYDSGEFTNLLNKALGLADWDGFAARQAESRARGRLRGRGISDYLELTGPPGREMGGIRFEPDGTVTIITGTLDYGQGHASPFAQVLSTRLGIPFRNIRLLQGDSDELIAGGGTGGSKSMMTSGKAIVEAGEKVVEKGREIAAHVLEAAAADIEFGAGRFTIAGTDRSVGLMELADKLRAGLKLPEGVPQSLDVQNISDGPPSAFPNGCHIAEVEVDPETGMVEVVRYSFVNDFGTVINPLLVNGQAHGGIVQGIGQALCEHVVYDETGQLLTGSYMDYGMPRADDAPMFTHAFHPVPAKTNVLGAKGCGEAGCAGALPSVMNALVDALGEYGIRHIDMPATPERVWRAIRRSPGGSTMTDDLWRLDATELARLIRLGRVSSRDASQSCLARLNAVNPSINAVVRVLEEEALAAAAAADEAQARGEPLGPLHGVPVTTKVNTDQAGCPTDNGVVAFRNNIARRDAPVIANLKRSGAIVIGRTNTPAFSMRAFADNALHGRTLNPRDPALSAGGSSGGAGAAVATGIGPIAHGNDIGGSVRIPAMYNGVVGLRVSLGRIPAYNPSQQIARAVGAQLMSVQGPLTRSLRDARLALAAMAQGDPIDTRWADVPLTGPPVPRPIGVALVPYNPGGYTHPAQAEAVRQAGRHLAAAGYTLEEIAPPDLDAVVETWHRIGSTDVLALLEPQMEEHGDPDAQTSMRLWRELSPPTDLRGVLGALAERDLLLWRWLEFMQRYPLVVMPTMGDLPPPHNLDTTREGAARMLDALRVSLISPVLGIPALAVPVGNHGRLRPGVQILAPRFREDLCLDAGEVIEAAEGAVTPIDPLTSGAP